MSGAEIFTVLWSNKLLFYGCWQKTPGSETNDFFFLTTHCIVRSALIVLVLVIHVS